MEYYGGGYGPGVGEANAHFGNTGAAQNGQAGYGSQLNPYLNAASGLIQGLTMPNPNYNDYGLTVDSARQQGKQKGGQIGSSVGSAVGTIFGPLGTAVGGLAGGLIGGALGGKSGANKGQQIVTRRDLKTQWRNNIMRQQLGPSNDEQMTELRQRYQRALALSSSNSNY